MQLFPVLQYSTKPILGGYEYFPKFSATEPPQLLTANLLVRITNRKQSGQ